MGKKSKSSDKEHDESVVTESEEVETTYEDKLKYAIPIAQPMASRKLFKKISKVVSKAKSHKSAVMGLKLVKKQVKLGKKGFLILGGDTDPLDVVSHLPCMCEEQNIPYVWVPMSRDIGGCALFIPPKDEYKKYYDEVYEQAKELPHPV